MLDRAFWMAATVVCLVVAMAVSLIHFREAPPVQRTLRYSIPVPGMTFSQALSPDGRYVAFHAVIETETQIFIRALDSLELRPVPGTEGVTNLFWTT